MLILRQSCYPLEYSTGKSLKEALGEVAYILDLNWLWFVLVVCVIVNYICKKAITQNEYRLIQS